MNSRYQLKDVIGGKNGKPGYYNTRLELDITYPIDLSDIETDIPSQLKGSVEYYSYLFQGTSYGLYPGSYVDIDNIIMPNDFTIIAFVRPQSQGQIFGWDYSYRSYYWYGNHFGVSENSNSQLTGRITEWYNYYSLLKKGHHMCE